MRTTDRAVWSSPESELPKLHLEAVVGEEATDERITSVQKQLDRLGRLKKTDHARKDPEHAGLLATRGEVRRRGLGIEAPITGTRGDPELCGGTIGHEGGELAVESEDRAVDD